MAVSLLALLDDIASVLDDIAAMTKVAAKNAAVLDDVASLTKVAAKKTAGVLGDDLALNAQQVTGVAAARELPVVWGVFKGSLLNKAVLVPAALLISVFIPWLISPLLMLGGLYLAFEGAEKVLHRFFHKDGEHEESEETPVTPEEAVALEKKKIKGAIRTDFILSAEIIVIALGSVPENSGIALQAAVLAVVALAMTVGVYGLVAGIVKLDDIGAWLIRKNPDGGMGRTIGQGLLRAAPLLMRFLGFAGTIAMFMVGGGILVHGLPWFHAITDLLEGLPLAGLTGSVFNAVVGLVAGALVLVAVSTIKKLLPKKKLA